MLSKLLKALLLSITLGCSAANASVVTFDGHSNSIWGDENPGNGLATQTSDGFQFVSSGDHFHFIDMAGYGGPSNGTSSLLEDRGYSVTMSQVGGGAFDLLSLLDYGYGGSSLLITGFFAGGGSISTEVSILGGVFTSETLSGFSNLSSVVFEGRTGGGFGLENIVVGEATQVPEPSSIVLLGLALAGLGFSRKKRA